MSLKTLYLKTLVMVGLVLVMFATQSNAQRVEPTITIANSTGANGQIVRIPVQLSNPSQVRISSFTFEITYNSTVIQLTPDEFVQTGTLCANAAARCTIATATTTSGNTRTTNFAVGTQNADITATNGILFFIEFNVVGTVGQSTPITFVIRTDGQFPVPRYETLNPQMGEPANGFFQVSNGSLTVSATTSASVNVAGRVLTENGRGLRGALVRMTSADGTTRTATTTSFGYYRFADVQVGQTVTIQILSKKYAFQPQTVNLTGDVMDLNFLAQP